MRLISLIPEFVEGIYANQYKPDLATPGRSDLIPWDIDLERQTARLREPISKAARLEFPLRPMVGCVGLAAEGETAPPSTISGAYGGNMDFNEIGEGATVMLPVYQPGALLFVGDGHAIQGDGQAMGNGLEVSMDLEFVVELHKRANLAGPRVETAEYIISMGSQPEFVSSLDRSLQMATTDMIHWLMDVYNVEPWAAHLLIGYQGNYRVVTVAGSMALKIPKHYLPPRRE